MIESVAYIKLLFFFLNVIFIFYTLKHIICFKQQKKPYANQKNQKNLDLHKTNFKDFQENSGFIYVIIIAKWLKIRVCSLYQASCPSPFFNFDKYTFNKYIIIL